MATGPGSEFSTIPTVVLLVMNYGCEEEVLSLVRDALAQQTSARLQIVVVENSPVPEQHPLRDIARDDAGIFLYAPGRNLGYFGGAAWGLERYREITASHQTAQPSPEWVIVSNPDIRFENRHFLQRMCELHREHPPTVVAPSIITSTGRDQNPYQLRRPRVMTMHLYALLYNHRWAARLYDAASRTKQGLVESIVTRRPRPEPVDVGSNSEVVREIYAPHGSFVVLHRSYFEAGGSLSYGAFLFGEEVHVAESVRIRGGRILFDPRLRVLHGDHPTTRAPSNELLDYSRDSYRYLLDQYFRPARDDDRSEEDPTGSKPLPPSAGRRP